jgi:hypothetical protein
MRFQNLAAFAAVALVISTAPAFAAKGQWSLGGNFGVGTYSNGDVNDQLQSIGADKIKDGWEFGGTLRHGMSDKMSLEIEGMAMNGKSETTEGTTTFTAHTKSFATPVNLLIGLAQNDKHDFSAIVGAGPMWNTKATSEISDPSGTVSGESGSKTAFMAQGGFEGDYFMSRQFALSGRALGRYAKASNVDNDKNDPSAGTFDIDHSGFAFNLGLRMFFGGGQ